MMAVRTQLTAEDVRAEGPGKPPRGDRGGRPAVGREVQRGLLQPPDTPRGSANWKTRTAPRPPGRAELAAPARLARQRQPLHRDQPRRAGPRLAVPALRIARRRQQAGREAHQDRAASSASAVDQPARPGPRLPGRGRRVLGLPARPPLGAALRPAEPRGDDDARRGCLGVVGQPVQRARRGELPPQLHRADDGDLLAVEAAEGRAGLAVPQGRDRRDHGQPG